MCQVREQQRLLRLFLFATRRLELRDGSKGRPCSSLCSSRLSVLFMRKVEHETCISAARTAIAEGKREPDGAFWRSLDPLYGPPKKATARIRTGDLLQS